MKNKRAFIIQELLPQSFLFLQLNKTTKTMYKLFSLIFLAIVLIGCNETPTSSQKPDHTSAKKEIRTAFKQYQSAILSQEGAKAIPCITKSTLEYFEGILDQVKFAEKEAILGASIADQTQILITRRLFSKKEIFSFDAEQLYATMIDKGFMGEYIKTLSIGLVAVKGDKGKAQMVLNGEKTAIFFDFAKENKQWKIDITTTLIMTTKFIEGQARKANISTTQYLLDMLQLNEEEAEQIWKPLELR